MSTKDNPRRTCRGIPVKQWSIEENSRGTAIVFSIMTHEVNPGFKSSSIASLASQAHE